MGAFTGFTPFSEDLQGFSMRPDSKYSGYDPSRLLAASQPKAAPAAPAAASQGAFPAPAPRAGAPIPALSPDDGKGAGEARKPKKQNDFFSIWNDGDAEDQDAVAANMEEVFANQGLSLEGATKMLYEQGGEVAARLGERYGLVPPADKAGMPAFKTQEQAVKDMDEGVANTKAKNAKRRAMGGFLMEVGHRILASNREDAAGAIGEGALGTMEARRQRGMQDEDRSIAKAEMERQRRRQEQADSRAESAEARAERADKRAEDRLTLDRDKFEQMKRDDELVKIVDEDGIVRFVPKKKGMVYDENGEPIRQSTTADLSAAQQAANTRAYQNAVNTAFNRIMKLGRGEIRKLYPELQDLEGEEYRKAAMAIAEREVAQADDSRGGTDPLGLGL